MRRIEILGIDAIASIAVVLWFMLGPWIDLYGFSVYHSRGDVWLPTPPSAINFFHGMVLSGSLLLVAVFLTASCVMLLVARLTGIPDDPSNGNFVYRAFFGDARKLRIKYCALFFATLLSPSLYNYMWRFHLTREGRIYGGFAMSLGIFIATMLIGGTLFPRRTPCRQPVPA